MHLLHTELAADLRSQRPGVIADLLAVFGREIQGVAYLILRNHADAEEILMDTLVTAWRKSGDLRDDTALRTWLLRIATRRALSRRRRIRQAWPLEPGRAGLPSADDGGSLDRLLLAEAMARLPARIRAAITLHHYAGLTVAETAQVLGTSQNTVKSQLRQGLMRLRVAMAAPEAVGNDRSHPDAGRL